MPFGRRIIFYGKEENLIVIYCKGGNFILESGTINEDSSTYRPDKAAAIYADADSNVEIRGGQVQSHTSGIHVAGNAKVNILNVDEVFGSSQALLVDYQDNPAVALKGGVFYRRGTAMIKLINTPENVNVKSILAPYCHYAESDKSKLTVEDNATEISKVEVVRPPFRSEFIFGINSIIYSPSATLNLEALCEANNSYTGEFTYQWYKNGVMIAGVNSAKYTETGLSAETYKYECVITREGYSKTVEANVYVNKANLTAEDYTAPEAIEKLEYSGDEQALIKEGSANIGTMKYRLGANGEWFETDKKAVITKPIE